MSEFPRMHLVAKWCFDFIWLSSLDIYSSNIIICKISISQDVIFKKIKALNEVENIDVANLHLGMINAVKDCAHCRLDVPKCTKNVGKLLCHNPGFLGHLGTLIICKAAQLFYRLSISLIFVCTPSKLSKASSTFNPNIITTCSATIFERSNSKRGIIGACALSARTYNTRVQDSDAQICNHFVKYNIKYLFCLVYRPD